MALDEISRSRSSAGSAAAEEPRAPQTEASAQDVDRFEQALQKKEQSGNQSGGSASGQGADKGSGFEQKPSDLSSIFSGLMSGQLNQAPAQPLPGSAAAQAAPLQGGDSIKSELQTLSDQLVDRILVSDPKYSQGSEVRLTLSAGSGILQDSEIVLRRDLQGLLAVEISCRNQEQFKKFVQLRPLLVEGLERSETQEVRFIINDPEALDEDESAPQSSEQFYGYR